MCEECGIWKERDGSFSEIIPSDCHDRGGHYLINTTRKGSVRTTGDRGRSAGEQPELTADEMETAKVA